jgi:hypothetical protein
VLRVGDPRGWWLLALAGLLLVVFLLRGRRRRVPSSLFFIVRRLADRLSVANRRLRLRRRVARALFAAAAVATAVAGLAPHTVSNARPLRELVIVDLSPSLGTSEGGAPRMRGLRQHLDRYLEQLQEQDTVLLVSAGPQAASTPALRGRAVRAAAAQLDYADAPADVAGAVRLAAALAREQPFDHVLLFTDRPGRWERPESAADTGALAPRIVTFGAAVPNAGIEAFDLEPDPLTPAAFDVYLRVSCPGARLAQGTRPLTLTLLNNDRVLQQLRRECAPGVPQEVLLEDVPLERGQAEVRLDPGDAYPGDDRVMAGVSDAPAAKVVLVSPGNRFLRAALEALPGVEVELRSPAEPLPQDPRAIYVFDGTVPRGAIPDKALFVQPDQQLDTLQVQTWRTYPERIDEEADDPLLRGVDLEGLTVKSLVAYAAAPGYRVAATADGWPLILARGEGGRRWVVFAFNPAETNLVYTAAFPVLIANTVRWLALFAAGERPFSRVGEAVFLPASARGGRVLTPGGDAVPIATEPAGSLAFLETRHPGRYQVSGADGAMLGNFYVNVIDPAVTAAAAADGYGNGTADLPPGLVRDPLRREYAPALALLALALLAAERFLVAARVSQRESS